MSHYEERLEHDLRKVKKRVRAMTETVVAAVAIEAAGCSSAPHSPQLRRHSRRM